MAWQYCCPSFSAIYIFFSNPLKFHIHSALTIWLAASFHSSDEGQLPAVQTLLPYHRNQQDDAISTETRETSAGIKQWQCCYQLMWQCFIVPTLEAVVRRALPFDWHVLPSCVWWKSETDCKRLRRLTSCVWQYALFIEYQPANQQALLRPQAKALEWFARGFLASDIVLITTVFARRAAATCLDGALENQLLHNISFLNLHFSNLNPLFLIPSWILTLRISQGGPEWTCHATTANHCLGSESWAVSTSATLPWMVWVLTLPFSSLYHLLGMLQFKKALTLTHHFPLCFPTTQNCLP